MAAEIVFKSHVTHAQRLHVVNECKSKEGMLFFFSEGGGWPGDRLWSDMFDLVSEVYGWSPTALMMDSF